MEALFGSDLLAHQDDGQTQLTPTQQRLRGKVVGVYFSAHWCPPCQQFTPLLAAFYRRLQAQGTPLEIVFVSSDKSEAEFSGYFSKMPWCALPYSARMQKEYLSSTFGVQGIPMLIFLDPAGKLIADDGRRIVMQDPSGEAFPWGTLSVPLEEPSNPTLFASGNLEKIFAKLKEHISEELGADSLDEELLDTVSKSIMEHHDISSKQFQSLVCLILQLPQGKLFALLDVIRLLFLRPAAVDLFVQEYGDMLTYLFAQFPEATPFTKTNILKMLCNAFSSTQAVMQLVEANYAPLMECISTAFLGEEDTVAARAATLLHNILGVHPPDGSEAETGALAALAGVLSSPDSVSRQSVDALSDMLWCVRKLISSQETHRDLWTSLEVPVLQLLDKEGCSERLQLLVLELAN